MQEPTKPERHIVSKGTYVANTGKKAVLASFGAAISLAGIAILALTPFIVVRLLGTVRENGVIFGLVVIGTVIVILGGLSCALVYYVTIFISSEVAEVEVAQAG